jgi:hypothetical protein
MLLKCQIHTKNQKKKKKKEASSSLTYTTHKRPPFSEPAKWILSKTSSFQNPYSNIHISDPVKSISPK